MIDLLHKIILQSATKFPDAEAIRYQGKAMTYAVLWSEIENLANAYLSLGLGRSERVAVYLEKRTENVIAMFAASACGAAFVPVNPLLKPEQINYILTDCNVKILVTSTSRLQTLSKFLPDCKDLSAIIVVDEGIQDFGFSSISIIEWEKILRSKENLSNRFRPHACIETDLAAILYTSGSTGKPKGVMLSHRNLLKGASSVSEYLENTCNDRILSILPLSFDYGLSQLTTAFLVGATVVLLNYLLPQDIVKIVYQEQITGLAAVPPLWIQLSKQKWPEKSSLRYITNSGGAMNPSTLSELKEIFPQVKIFLMYGLTEAFRSSYLDPAEIDFRETSIGKAIPGEELLVLNQQGQICAPEEEGELVHRGALVSMGYWNDAEKTAERFRPWPFRLSGAVQTEMAVWSGDIVKTDHQGFLYFVGRTDDMIKISGYRVSPTEIEEVGYRIPEVFEMAAIGVPHPLSGQAIVLVIKQINDGKLSSETVINFLKMHLPLYMLPSHIAFVDDHLLRNSNGKIDRKFLQLQFNHHFQHIIR